MKIRIQDHSVRFRITLRELEKLETEGLIESRTEIFSKETRKCVGRFVYGIKKQEEINESTCELNPGSIWMILNRQDWEKLKDPQEEGVYLRQEVEKEDGSFHRFISFVEKDRPASKCDKPEMWIYDHQSNHALPIHDTLELE